MGAISLGLENGCAVFNGVVNRRLAVAIYDSHIKRKLRLIHEDVVR
jgi:hypothetical protein